MAILAQLSADFALTYNFQGTDILGGLRGHFCDSVIFLFLHLFQVQRNGDNKSIWTRQRPDLVG